MPSSYSRMSLEELRLCAQEGDTEAEYLLGQRLLGQRGRALEGMEHLKRAAAKRHLQACERLGSAYLYGEGDVPQDKKQATVYYEQALSLGSTTARRQLIRLYLESEERAERGLQLLTEAAEEGDKEAAARAARAYLSGEIAGVDLDRAARYALASGDSAVQYETAARLETLGAAQETREALYRALLLRDREGAALNLRDCLTLSEMYAQGKGTKPDGRAAERLLRRAVELERQQAVADPRAGLSLAALYESGAPGLPADHAAARKLLQALSRGGSEVARLRCIRLCTADGLYLEAYRASAEARRYGEALRFVLETWEKIPDPAAFAAQALLFVAPNRREGEDARALRQELYRRALQAGTPPDRVLDAALRLGDAAGARDCFREMSDADKSRVYENREFCASLPANLGPEGEELRAWLLEPPEDWRRYAVDLARLKAAPSENARWALRQKLLPALPPARADEALPLSALRAALQAVRDPEESAPQPEPGPRPERQPFRLPRRRTAPAENLFAQVEALRRLDPGPQRDEALAALEGRWRALAEQFAREDPADPAAVRRAQDCETNLLEAARALYGDAPSEAFAAVCAAVRRLLPGTFAELAAQVERALALTPGLEKEAAVQALEERWRDLTRAFSGENLADPAAVRRAEDCEREVLEAARALYGDAPSTAFDTACAAVRRLLPSEFAKLAKVVADVRALPPGDGRDEVLRALESCWQSQFTILSRAHSGDADAVRRAAALEREVLEPARALYGDAPSEAFDAVCAAARRLCSGGSEGVARLDRLRAQWEKCRDDPIKSVRFAIETLQELPRQDRDARELRFALQEVLRQGWKMFSVYLRREEEKGERSPSARAERARYIRREFLEPARPLYEDAPCAEYDALCAEVEALLERDAPAAPPKEAEPAAEPDWEEKRRALSVDRSAPEAFRELVRLWRETPPVGGTDGAALVRYRGALLREMRALLLECCRGLERCRAPKDRQRCARNALQRLEVEDAAALPVRAEWEETRALLRHAAEAPEAQDWTERLEAFNSLTREEDKRAFARGPQGDLPPKRADEDANLSILRLLLEPYRGEGLTPRAAEEAQEKRPMEPEDSDDGDDLEEVDALLDELDDGDEEEEEAPRRPRRRRSHRRPRRANSDEGRREALRRRWRRFRLYLRLALLVAAIAASVYFAWPEVRDKVLPKLSGLAATPVETSAPPESDGGEAPDEDAPALPATLMELEPTSAPTHFYLNYWTNPTYEGELQIRDGEEILSCDGIGWFVPSSSIEGEGGVGAVEARYKLPGAYTSLRFRLAPDAVWNDDSTDASFRLTVYCDGELAYDSDWRCSAAAAADVTVDVSGVRELVFSLEETRSRAGTINVVMADLALS